MPVPSLVMFGATGNSYAKLLAVCEIGFDDGLGYRKRIGALNLFRSRNGKFSSRNEVTYLASGTSYIPG